MEPRKTVLLQLIQLLFFSSGLSGEINNRTTPLPECDHVIVQYRTTNCDGLGEFDFDLTMQVADTDFSIHNHCYGICKNEIDALIDISREKINVWHQMNGLDCDEKREAGSQFETLEGRSLTISSRQAIAWEVHIFDNCNAANVQMWRSGTYAAGGAAIFFLLTTLSLMAIYSFYLKEIIKGQDRLKKSQEETPNSNEKLDQRSQNSTLGDTATPDIKENTPHFLGSNHFVTRSQPNTPQTKRGMAAFGYTNPSAINSSLDQETDSSKPIYANLPDTSRPNGLAIYEPKPVMNEQVMYVNLPGARY